MTDDDLKAKIERVRQRLAARNAPPWYDDAVDLLDALQARLTQ